MDIFYEDGTPIQEITLRNLKDVQENKGRISAGLLTNDNNFVLLFTHWLKACIDFMWYLDHKEENAPDEEYVNVFGFFCADAQETECSEFLEKFVQLLTRRPKPNILSKDEAECICSSIDGQLQDSPPYLRLRTAAVCLLLNRFPEEAFSEGDGWINILGGAAAETVYTDSLLPVQDGTVFELDPAVSFQSGAELLPRTLCNQSEDAVSFTVQYGGSEYTIKLPPYGILRAVFSDKNCKKLVSIKGNISFAGTKRAVIQKGTQDGAKLLFISTRCTSPLEYPQTGVLLDACAAELGGAVVLDANGMYSTVDESLDRTKKDGLPVRCYRSGHQWAWLYADGRLESNLPDKAPKNGAAAVVEDAERGLLVYGPEGAVDCRSSRVGEISKDEFVRLMLGRFQHGNDCEYQETQFMKAAVHASGKTEVVR